MWRHLLAAARLHEFGFSLPRDENLSNLTKDRESGKDANVDFRGICQKADASEIDTERLLYLGTALLPQTRPFSKVRGVKRSSCRHRVRYQYETAKHVIASFPKAEIPLFEKNPKKKSKVSDEDSKIAGKKCRQHKWKL